MYELTTQQKNIYNLQKYYENTAIANIGGAMFIDEKLDMDVFEQAVCRMIDANDAFHIRLTEENGKAMQYVKRDGCYHLVRKTFLNREDFDAFAEEETKKPINVKECEMYRAVLCEIADKTAFYICTSHLISDAWTISLMGREIMSHYDNLLSGEDNREQKPSYVEYILSEQEYMKSDKYKKDEAYWAEIWKEKPQPASVKPQQSMQEGNSNTNRLDRTLSVELTRKIKEYEREKNISPAVLFESAAMVYLAKLNPELTRLSIGVPVLNRSNRKEKQIMGMFVSTMPLCIEIAEDDTCFKLQEKLTRAHLGMFRHQKMPYSHIVQNLRKQYKEVDKLYDVMVSFQNATIESAHPISTRWYGNGASEVPLTLHIDQRTQSDCFTITLDYQYGVFSDEEIVYIFNRIVYLLEQIVDNADKNISDYSILPEREQKKVQEEFNDTYIEFPNEKCIHELFTEQAERTPNQTALIFEDKKFTYKELDEMSNSLAHFLREKGVKRNDVVPIIARRSWHVIVAMLGVLKAGGAYMPVDPDYPVERVEYMLQQICAKIVLTYEWSNSDLPQELVDLCELDYKDKCDKIVNINVSSDLCYVLFTSGSTGKPKATLISHANLGNFVNNNNNNYQCTMVRYCACVLADTTFTFDVSVFEIYLSLVNGLIIVLTKEEANAEYLARLIVDNNVDVIHITPTKLLMLLQNEAFQKAINRVKMLMVGAEVFSEELYRTIAKYTDATIYNGYGPTETTIGCSFKRINKSQKCVHELFTEQAERTPDQTALIFEDKKFTYKELDEMSNSLAHFLREKGVKRNDVVPIIARRSWHYVVSSIAVLKSGGAFMPVDPDYPKNRIIYMLEESNSDIILTYLYTPKIENYTVINLEDVDYGSKAESVECVNCSDDNCYVIFTSGTTGNPKGTIITHNNLVNFISINDINKYQFDVVNNSKMFLSDIKYCFDPHVFHIYLPLINGLSLVMTPDRCNGDDIGHFIEKYGCDTMNCTPTMLQMYMQSKEFKNAISNIKIISVGAEVFQQQLKRDIEKYSNAKIYNVYGPTETTIISSEKKVEVSAKDITIGRPIANTQIYILDKENNLLPIGVAGELCIAGAGVGKGYLNRPELTAEKFVPNPFATKENHHGSVMYHTGDLARWRADGEIEYLGRIDTQVKIRGLRIELGEIESVMSSFEGIGLTAVTDKRDENNRQYLVGYYTAPSIVDEKELRHHLSEKLPKYMVPNYFMHLETMPMTPSGKTDRKNLPMPDFSMRTEEYVAPESETEKRLAEIWKKLLKMERVGKADDFFELGGDSLLAITMVSDISNIFHVEISIKDVMEYSSLDKLAHCIEGAKQSKKIAATGKKEYVLLPQQKAIYASYSKNPNSLTYNMPAFIDLPENIDLEKLKQSIRKVVSHHKLLMSSIRVKEEEITGIYDETAELIFEEYEVGEEKQFIRAFDLGRAPLVRIGFTKKQMLFDIHHIVADGESLNIVLRDIVLVYQGEELPENETEYADYSEYFYSRDLQEQKNYFRQMLKCDFEPVVLPETQCPSEGGRSKLYTISQNTVKAAKEFAKENNLTPTMVFLGAYGILLNKYSASQDILSSIVLQNRMHTDTKDMVGMFVNTLPVYLLVQGSMAEYVQYVRRLVLNLYENQELPHSMIADAVGMTDRNVVNTLFVYQADGEKKLFLDGQEMIPQFIETNTAKFDLTMELTPVQEELRVRMEYNCEKYDEKLMDRLMEAYIRILSQLAMEKISDISVMSDEEKRKVLEEFNDTYIEFPNEKCIHELFTEQAERTPDQTALIFEDKKFTYKELDEMSNSLAHFLREKGVKRNDVVPIIARRSWHVIVAMLGVLKAGGAYMPVDPDYPAERVEYMLQQICAKIVLVYEWNNNGLSQELVDLCELDYKDNCEKIANINISSDSCYVLFTSGSTGRPKAILISHSNLGNFVNNNNNNNYQCTMVSYCACVLADTTFTFDISVFEIYLSLVNGLTIVLTKEAANADYLAQLIVDNNVDAIHITPTKLLMLLQNEAFQKAINRVKMLMVGAEVFSKELYQTIAKYTDATIYNGYGPTETTIGCSFKHINKSEKCIHELFTEQAERTPNQTALIFEDKQFTYKELDEMSNSLAHFLREKGVKRNDVVPIIARRSWHVIVAMLGVLKAGGAYMLIDYQYPKDRVKYLVKECKAKIVLTYGCEYDEGISIEKIINTHNTKSLECQNDAMDIFCVIHTSGSTGVPKVTSLTHKNISHYIDYSKELFRETKQTISTTIITFDAFIQETIVALCNGVPVVLMTEDEMTKQSEFEKKVLQFSDSFLFQTPTKLLNYIRNSETGEFLKSIKSFVLGGEVFPQELYEKIEESNSECRIYNIYGPTETTVCCTVDKLGDSTDITIGKPIANTQIYILDKENNLLPIGVAGELCIAGAGVGKGYLNRPELTAQKFVPNPFATKENHHGSVMYHTGDLARWRADGEIEYLGRIDTQVKIRGLRIELGEIESVMSSFEGISLTAVADKRDENNRQYLVGYYTAPSIVDEKELRRHLSEKLPKYMVPNYFMHLETMPMTPSGKIDRKNLPMPDFSMRTEEYIAPESETEKCLCSLLAQQLHMEKVGVTDDFFEIGGDSLGAIEYVAKAHGMGIEFALQNVFDYPTVRSLCGYLNTGAEDKVAYDPKDFEKYRCIFEKNVVDDSFVPKKKPLGNILLTGATGFLGAHVLDRLMKEEKGIIYCLLRGENEDDRRGRLYRILEYYFGDTYQSEYGKRIIPVVGNIEKEGLADHMPGDIQTVIHTAATVKHYGSYSYFHKVNAEGTKHVADFAKSAGAKLIHVSTLSVSGNTMADDFTAYRCEEEKFFYETSYYIGQPLDNVYIHSKFEAERQVYDAMLQGLDAKVIRVGNLTSRTRDYKFQPNYRENAFLTRVKAVLEFGLFPEYLMPLYAEFSPIDQTAEGIVKIAQYADRQNVFHLNSDRVLHFNRLIEILHELGIPMKVVDGAAFYQALQATLKDTATEYIFEALQNDMDDKGELVYDSNIRIMNDFTLWFMGKVGFKWAEIDMEYIRGYLKYFMELGYLEV